MLALSIATTPDIEMEEEAGSEGKGRRMEDSPVVRFRCEERSPGRSWPSARSQGAPGGGAKR